MQSEVTHFHECPACRKKFGCPLFDCMDQRLKGCDECTGIVESIRAQVVAAQLARDGQLVFRRHPNYLGIVAGILLIGLVVSFVLDFGLGPSPMRAVSGWLIILLSVGCIIKAVRWRNRIILTQAAFEEHNHRGLFGRKRQVTIPWERVEASEESNNTFGGHASIFIKDKSGSFLGNYGASTTSDYRTFRGTLISRVGLRVERTEYRDV